MRRSSASKKSGQSNSTPNAADLFRSASSKASSKESERIDSLFYSYANGSTGLIDPEGIETLCADMEVDHTDVRVLMLAWKMKAEEQGYFTLDEWRRGLKALRADTVSKLKKALPDLEKEVRRPSNFTDFYSYAFQYCLTEEKQKSIDIESICELLTLVLGSTFPAQVNLFVEYLKAQNDYKVINMDQWMGFFRFCNEVASFSLLLLDCLYISYQEDGIFWLFFHSKVFSIVCSSQKNISVVTASNF
ncbi:DCN1-like protein 4 isoform B [Glycine soja]|uniref:Defective in cullin neddylation protein n=1 Tax=Glycine soja TaxID=3848 RepID=A0A445EY68_GLYSO|nr:DCN1-like protein 4 isoform B [Glycine soja]